MIEIREKVSSRSGGPLQRAVSEAIVRAAREELAEQGFARFSVENVARRAEVGKAALYRYTAIPPLALEGGDAGTAIQSDSLAYDLVRDLTTKFGPRPAGSAAEAAAAKWGSDKMREFGFQAVAIERFPLLRWGPGDTRVELLGDGWYRA